MSMNVSINILFIAHPTQYATTFGPKKLQAIFSLATYRPVLCINIFHLFYLLLQAQFFSESEIDGK